MSMEKKQDKGFRPGEREKLLRQVKNSLSEEEAHRLIEQRKFDNIVPGSYTYKIALHLDQLRKQLREKQNLMMKRLWNIDNIEQMIIRCKAQLTSNKIVEKLPDSDSIMTEGELKSYMKHQEWLQIGEVRAIAPILADIRSLVGHKDVIGEDILTEEQFDKYYEEIEKELVEMGKTIYD